MKISIALLVHWVIIMLLHMTDGYPIITLDLEDHSSYSAFITSLRTQLNAGMVCGIAATRSKASAGEQFVLVDVKFTEQKKLTIALNVTNVYLTAYSDNFDGKERARFFSDTLSVAKGILFQEAVQSNIGYTSGYNDLGRVAGQGREKIELGFSKFRYAVESVSGKPIKKDLEAKFLIIAIQLVSEASRFKYIEKKVVEGGEFGSFKPDAKMLNLENNWSEISKEIHKSASGKPTKCENISPPLKLKDPNDKDWSVSKVNEISPDLGLLKY